MLNVTRDEVAIALSGVADVRGHEHRPAILGEGDAWPLISSLDSAAGHEFVTSWRILLVLSADERLAADQFTTLAPLLVDALRPVAWVEEIRPVTIQTSAGDVPGLQITARSD